MKEKITFENQNSLSLTLHLKINHEISNLHNNDYYDQITLVYKKILSSSLSLSLSLYLSPLFLNAIQNQRLKKIDTLLTLVNTDKLFVHTTKKLQ